MKNKVIRQVICPLLAAMIWGSAFVFQSVSTEFIEPFTFNMARSLVASVFLLGLALVMRAFRGEKKEVSMQDKKAYRKELMMGGICCGVFLTIASNLQQLGIAYTTTGKAGFITALYIVVVPVAGIFFRKKVDFTVWISVLLAVAGLYFLCVTEGFSVAAGDFYVFLCAIFFAGQILMVDHFAQKVDGVELSLVQFIVMTVLSGICMLIFESPDWPAIRACIGPILYVGVFSSGVAYTLQIVAQKDANPTVVSVLMSMESVFATLSGAIFLQEVLSGREYAGCALMLVAVVLVQIPVPKKKTA